MRSEDYFAEYATEVYEPRVFRSLANALEAYPAHELPDPKSVGTAQRLRDAFMQAEKTVQLWTDSVLRNQPEEDRYRILIQELHEYIEQQIKALRKQADAL